MTRRRTWIFMGIGAVVGAALTPYVVPSILGWFGFGSAGPVAGGLAAGIQSGIGNVVAGRLFAHVQSMAMGGLISVGPYAIMGAVGGGVGWAVNKILRWFGW
ncbi:hypothetical protein EDD18DRAFT_784700 [Armillaria luteobubalina]|uniref:Uncharacterized protein n=1 Tax=Armillaria luteobubalina TaxID=153913 RepID=A0AA39USB9_9AGAR|nr:hypothetical protein EDD18DRAFT_784700 [Armillaria luteobubalina]